MTERPRHTAVLFVAAVMALTAAGLATAPPASAARLAAPGTWHVQASPNITTPSGALASVSCVAARACMAVGDYTSTAGLFVTLAERWDGTSWRTQPTPTPAGGSNLLLGGVSCASASLCEAVGSYIVHNGAARLGLAEQWNGRTWHLQAFPAPGGSPDVEPVAVSCPAATFCVAVGKYQNSSGVYVPLAEFWNGASWLPQSVPGQGGLELNGVSCLATTFCEVVGDSSPTGQDAEVWNGRSWSLQTIPAPAHAVGLGLAGVTCIAANLCEAVGNWLAPHGELPRSFTLAEAWNGTSWAIQPTPSPKALPSSVLSGVSCTSASLCTAVGSNFDPLSAASVTLAEQWNSVSWREVPTPAAPGYGFAELGGVSCAAASACEAVGILQGASEVALAEAWDGRSWTIQRAAARGATSNFLSAVSCVTASYCAAVGTGFDHAGIYASLAEVWNGATWKIQPTPNPAKRSNVDAILNGVSCVSAGFCVAVGQSNSIPDLLTEVWNGSSWAIKTAPGTGALTSVSCPSANFCAAVGSTAAIAGSVAEVDLWNGHSWSAVPPASGFSSLTSVSCASPRRCEAVGAGPTGHDAQVWNGRSWSVQATPVPAGADPRTVNFNGVSCPGPNACEAVGGYTTSAFLGATLAEGWNGQNWAIQPTPSPKPRQGPTLQAVWCSSPSACAAVGRIASSAFTGLTLAEAWNGSSWQVQPTPTPNRRAGGAALTGVWCGANLTCVASGDGTDPGGTPATLIEQRS